MQMERKGNGVAAELETGHVGSDCLICGIQPLQVCVEVASGTTGQSDFIALDGCPRLSGNLFGYI